MQLPPLSRALLMFANPVLATQQRLRDHGFSAPFSPDSVGLVSSLLDALVDARAQNARLVATANKQAAELFTAEQQAPPLRCEIGRLVRENNKLHTMLIGHAEETAAARREADAELSSARRQLRDVSFLCASLRQCLREREQESAGLREMASRSFELNGVVLPSGHEVRWHGRKERLESHSPAPPSRGGDAADGVVAVATGGDDMPRLTQVADAPQLVPAAEPARLVRAAEGQLSSLLHRVDAADARVCELEASAEEAEQQIAARDAELVRLGGLLGEARAVGSSADERRCERESSASAINQLSSQVNFLNTRCTELEQALRAETAKAQAAHADDDERQRLLDAIGGLRDERARINVDLGHAAALAGKLGLARPAALMPFA